MRTAKFNGEYGYDEGIIAVPPNVTDTYDHEDDDEEENIICDPNVDYECDGDTLDNYDGWYYDEEHFDVFRLQELIKLCEKQVDDLKVEYLALTNTLSAEAKQEIDVLFDQIQNEIHNLGAYMANPMVFSNNFDMYVMLKCLETKETLPDIIILTKQIRG